MVPIPVIWTPLSTADEIPVWWTSNLPAPFPAINVWSKYKSVGAYPEPWDWISAVWIEPPAILTFAVAPLHVVPEGLALPSKSFIL